MKEETKIEIMKLLNLPGNQKFKQNLEEMNLLELNYFKNIWETSAECTMLNPHGVNEHQLKKQQFNVKAYELYIEKKGGTDDRGQYC